MGSFRLSLHHFFEQDPLLPLEISLHIYLNKEVEGLPKSNYQPYENNNTGHEKMQNKTIKQ